MYISIYDLGLLILFVGLVVVGIYLIVVLQRVLCILGIVRTFLDTHQENIGESVTQFKEAITNLNELCLTLKETTEHTTQAVRAFPDDITDTIEDLRESFETFAFYARLIKDIVKSIFSKVA